jgi:hypothetical protein
MSLLLGLSAFLGQHILVDHWPAWVTAVLFTLVLALVLALRLGLPADLRRGVLARLRDMAGRLRSRGTS